MSKDVKTFCLFLLIFESRQYMVQYITGDRGTLFHSKLFFPVDREYINRLFSIPISTFTVFGRV